MEDLISRQAVLGLIADYDLSMEQVVKGIFALPPVTPQPKTEKVIKMRDATSEERESIDKYVKSISKSTVVNFWDLEQEPITDRVEYGTDGNAYRLTISNGKEFKQEPKTGHWISVDDRLPKNDEDVLVCNSQGAMEVCYYHIDDTHYPTQYADLNETGWYNEDDDVLGFEPIACMPLPEPYKPD